MDNLGWLILGISIAVVLIAVLAWFFVTRSRLVAGSSRVDEAWHDVTDQLKRRNDLVPGLVGAVREFAGPDQPVYGELTTASEAAVASAEPTGASTAENRVQGALRSLFGLASAYPQLTASPMFLQMRADLVQTEDKIQAARRQYNGAVRGFNRQVTGFPNRMVAGAAHAHEREFYEVSDRAAISEPPRVQF